MKFRSPGVEQEPTVYLKECISALINNLVHNMRERYLVRLRILKTENVQYELVALVIGAVISLQLMCFGA